MRCASFGPIVNYNCIRAVDAFPLEKQSDFALLVLDWTDQIARRTNTACKLGAAAIAEGSRHREEKSEQASEKRGASALAASEICPSFVPVTDLHNG